MKMSRLLRGLVVMALLVGACAGEGRTKIVRQPNVAFPNVSSLVRYAAADGAMPTVIHGNPFSGTQAQADQAVRAGLHMPGGLPRAAFVTDAAAEAGEGLRLVLVFDPADATFDAKRMCGDVRSIALGGSGNRAIIHASFCSGDKLIRGVLARTDPAEAMERGFERALRDITFNLFRRISPHLPII